jgi:hypothetical protein
MHLTIDQIAGIGVRQMLIFANHFPDGLDVSIEGIKKAQEVGLNLNGLADLLLTPESLNGFRELQSKAWVELYGNPKNLAWQRYMKQMREAGEDSVKRDATVTEFSDALARAAENFQTLTRAQFLACVSMEYNLNPEAPTSLDCPTDK